ncbi:hypothetical protein ACO0LG_22695 [Undibacterium sp. Ji42W]|uniref:hypothetical protein n=1 Tax=Undibacterium sp. Ji42W TaxID=3413039 RepID=UPI003BEFE36F
MIYAGIQHDATDQTTGAPAAFHVVGTYTVDLRSKLTVAVILAFFNQATYSASKNPLFQTTATIKAVPPRDMDPVTWIYEHLVQTVEGETNSSNIFADAVLIDAEV